MQCCAFFQLNFDSDLKFGVRLLVQGAPHFLSYMYFSSRNDVPTGFGIFFFNFFLFQVHHVAYEHTYII